MSELTTLFQNTAYAIRSKTGDTETMQASQFPAKIQGISVGISQDDADARYLQLSGGTMTGPLTLSGSPTGDLQAATKKYVDDQVSGKLIGEASNNTNTLVYLTCTQEEALMLKGIVLVGESISETAGQLGIDGVLLWNTNGKINATLTIPFVGGNGQTKTAYLHTASSTTPAITTVINATTSRPYIGGVNCYGFNLKIYAL